MFKIVVSGFSVLRETTILHSLLARKGGALSGAKKQPNANITAVWNHGRTFRQAAVALQVRGPPNGTVV